MIDEMEIQNYRSVWEPTVVPIDDRISILIGANEAGKSNLLKGISKFKDEEPILPKSLSNNREYNPDEYGDINVLTSIFRKDACDDIQWLEEPHTYDDTLDIPLGGDETVPTQEELYHSKLLSQYRLAIIRYASGAHKVTFVDTDNEYIENDDFPISIEEFLDGRKRDVVKIAEQFVNHLGASRDLNKFLTDETEFHEENDLVDNLDAVERGIRGEQRESESEDVEELLHTPETIDLPSLDELAQQASELNTLLSTIDSVNDPLQTFPNIINQMSIDLAESEYDLINDSQSPVLRGLFSLGSISLENYSSYNSSRLEDDLKNACTELERLLNAFWAFDVARRDEIDELPPLGEEPYSVSFEKTETALKLYLQEGDEEKVLLGQRSDGLRWIMTFLLSILGERSDSNKRGIILLDDPGIHLHPEAERQLLRALYYVVPQAQVIYSTHSPGLIDQSNPQQLRVVQYDSDNGTSVTQDLQQASDVDSGIDILRTVREALGWTLNHSLFAGEQTILVEGLTDKIYIELFNEYFSYEGDRSYLDETTVILDGGGDKIAFLSRILNAEDIDHVLLLDDDKVGQEFDDWMEDQTLFYRDLDWDSIGDYPMEVEDLLNPELVVTSLNEELPEPVELNLEATLGHIEHVDQPIMDLLDSKFDDIDLDDLKGDLATNISKKVREAHRSRSDEYQDTGKRFEQLIEELNSKLQNHSQ